MWPLLQPLRGVRSELQLAVYALGYSYFSFVVFVLTRRLGCGYRGGLENRRASEGDPTLSPVRVRDPGAACEREQLCHGQGPRG